MALNKEQQQKIRDYFTKFKSSAGFREELASREKRRELIVPLLSRERLRSITEREFGELISKLWASTLWGNKEYLVQKIVAQMEWVKSLTNLKYYYMEQIHLKRDLTDF